MMKTDKTFIHVNARKCAVKHIKKCIKIPFCAFREVTRL